MTAALIHQRTSRHRALVIAVVSVSFASVLSTAIARSWLPLLGLPVLVPLCSVFFSMDLWLVARWRRCILRLWADGTLDIPSFRQASKSMSALPPQTLAAMLNTLPDDKVSRAPGMTDPGLRGAIAHVLRGIDLRGGHDATATTAALAIAVGGAVAALVAESWAPLVATTLSPLLVVSSRLLSTLRLRRTVVATARLQPEGASRAAFVSVALCLDWRDVPDRERDRVMRALTESLGAVGGPCSVVPANSKAPQRS